jgi:hypothetical protein
MESFVLVSSFYTIFQDHNIPVFYDGELCTGQ